MTINLSCTHELHYNSTAQQLSETIKNTRMKLSDVQDIASNQNHLPFDLLLPELTDIASTVDKIPSSIYDGPGNVPGRSKNVASDFKGIS
uniref:Uncharacterized protein n=1 Tax=Cucumis melo TaxID=3656 RepID=A0A9I9CIS9_CUCME